MPEKTGDEFHWHVWVDKQLDQEKPNEQNELGSESSFHFSNSRFPSSTVMTRIFCWRFFTHKSYGMTGAVRRFPSPVISGPCWAAGKSQRDPSEPRRASLTRLRLCLGLVDLEIFPRIFRFFLAVEPKSVCSPRRMFLAVKTRGGSLSLQSKLISGSFQVKPFWQKLIW